MNLLKIFIEFWDFSKLFNFLKFSKNMFLTDFFISKNVSRKISEYLSDANVQFPQESRKTLPR